MAHILQFSCDDETGEVLTYEVNGETGEPCIEKGSPPLFVERVTSETSATSHQNYPKFPHHGYFSKTKKYQSLKASIIAGSNPISHRMMLIPTLMFCPALLCSILMILEVYLHIRCHKKNKSLKDPTMFYQSPFHIITSTFCGVCRDSDAASKIGHMQDKRRSRYDYFRGIAI